MLRITVDHRPDQINLRLEGDLSGPWVSELEECWRAARLTLGGRALCVDLAQVQRVDEAGKYLLALLRINGAVLLGAGAEMTDLVQTITNNWPPSQG
jgi:ABC-type transporter Mla MlaB component